jgi:Bacterial alpha-L-rhamnosidase 6 hairpin glycosidase domain
MMNEGAAVSSSRGLVARIVLLAMSLVLSACGPDPTGEKPGSGNDAGAPPADAASGGDGPLDGSPAVDGSPTDGGDGGSATDAGGDPGSKGDPFNFAPSSRTVVPVAVFSTAGAVSNPNNVLSGKPTTLAGAGAQIVLDFGKEVGGILSLEFAGAAGNPTLGAAFSESSLYVGPNSDNSAGGGSSDGALALSVAGPMSWTSESKHLRGGFRYLTLFVNGGSIDVTGVSLAFSPDPERAIPNQYPNYFYSNDEVLNKAWYGGAYTFQTNVIANHQGRIPPAPASNWDNTAAVGEAGKVVLVDGAKRDRTVWPGDMVISLPTGYAALHDTEAAKNALVTLFNHQQGDGHLQWCGPPWNLDFGSDTYHLWTLYGTYLGYVYSGDKPWLDSVWAQYKTGIAYITNKIDANGLLNVTGTADWGPRVDQGGENIEANAILYAVLTGSVTLAEAEGDGASATSYAALAATLKTKINATLWDSSVGAFRDNPASNLHPQDGNALAVWFGVIDDPARARGLSYVHQANWNAIGSVTPEWGQISTFVGSMELMSHFVAGYDKRGLDMIRMMWGYMLSSPNGPQSTFWESFTTDGGFGSNGNGPAPSDSFTSLAHGWGTGPTSALTFFVLGVAPDSVLGQTYHVTPHPGDLRHVEGRLTLAPGKLVQVTYDVGVGCSSFSMTVDASSNTGSTGTIGVPKLGAKHTVTIGGAVAWNGTSFVGASGVGGATEDDAYIYFTGVQPGKYVVAYTDGTGCGPAPEQWTFCAAENGSCAISGTKRVRYGRDGKYAYRLADGSAGAIACTSAAFGGDPIPNVVKACHFSDELFTSCAAEGATCSFSGTKEVRFGANGQWKTLTATGSALCNAATFGGDPLPNVVKTCEYR